MSSLNNTSATPEAHSTDTKDTKDTVWDNKNTFDEMYKSIFIDMASITNTAFPTHFKNNMLNNNVLNK